MWWNHFPGMERPLEAPQNLKMAQKGKKWQLFGHWRAWWLQISGSVWIKVGSSQGTSRAYWWNHSLGPEWPLGGAVGPQNGHLWSLMASLSHFGAPGASKWPHQTKEMVPTLCPGYALTWSNLDPPWSSSLEPPGPPMASSWPFLVSLSHFEAYGAPNGYSRPRKRFHRIALDVP